MYMKKKVVTKKKPQISSRTSAVRKMSRKHEGDDKYVILVRSWVFLVLFAIMLGVGVIVGNYINAELNGGAPTVAGYSTDR
jgi:hypothetical protein